MEPIRIPGGTTAQVRRERGLLHRPKLEPSDQEPEAAVEPAASDGSLERFVPSALISTEQRAAALIAGGAPAWSRRLRRIDEWSDQALVELEAAWRALAGAGHASPADFAADWSEYARAYDFSVVNDLIARHNLYFPIERRLPMDVHTGDFVGPGGREFRRKPLDAEWILERFPADLERARRSTQSGAAWG